MFLSREIKNNLLGCFEVFLFMPSGIKRFSASKKSAVKSFIVPAILLPFVLYIMASMSVGFSANLLVPLHVGRIVISLALFFTIVYFLSKQFDRVEHFWRFITVTNWCEIIATILAVPILYGFISGQDLSSFESYAVFITIAGYVYSAFIVTHAFRLPWELGGFIAIVGLAVNENLLEVTAFVRDSLAYSV